jgi:hypothetical protein
LSDLGLVVEDITHILLPYKPVHLYFVFFVAFIFFIRLVQKWALTTEFICLAKEIALGRHGTFHFKLIEGFGGMTLRFILRHSFGRYQILSI